MPRHLAISPDIAWFHLGSEIIGMEENVDGLESPFELADHLEQSKSFLMVGTLEARKGHSQVLYAFEELWARGLDLCLVIVGKKGWHVESLVKKLETHPESGKRLFCLENTDDFSLEKIYSASTCLIAASEGEGFGLPLIEAARHRLPIIARNIPVFREVAGDNAYYFQGLKPHDISTAIQKWLPLFASGRHPKSEKIPWLTWEESVSSIKDLILKSPYGDSNKIRNPGQQAGNMPSSRAFPLSQDKLENKENDWVIDPKSQNNGSSVKYPEELGYLENVIDFENGLDRGKLSEKEILVYSPAKTGTVSLYFSLKNFLGLDDNQMLHNHNNWSLVNSLKLPDNLTIDQISARPIVRDLLAYKTRAGGQVRIVSSYRDPLSRAISLVFQFMENLVVRKQTHTLQDISYEMCYNRLLTNLNNFLQAKHPLEEIDPAFFENQSFDHATKTCYVKKANYEILVLCLEHSSYWPSAFKRSFGYKTLNISNQNRSEDKVISSLSREFKEKLELPPNLIRQVYYGNHRQREHLRWFYTETEIEEFCNSSLKLYASGKGKNDRKNNSRQRRPGNLQERLAAAREFLEGGNWTKAALQYESIRKEFPSAPPQAWVGATNALTRTGDIDKAVTLAKEAVEKFPERPNVQLSLGSSLLLNQQWEEAAAAFAEIRARFPRRPPGYNFKGRGR